MESPRTSGASAALLTPGLQTFSFQNSETKSPVCDHLSRRPRETNPVSTHLSVFLPFIFMLSYLSGFFHLSGA